MTAEAALKNIMLVVLMNRCASEYLTTGAGIGNLVTENKNEQHEKDGRPQHWKRLRCPRNRLASPFVLLASHLNNFITRQSERPCQHVKRGGSKRFFASSTTNCLIANSYPVYMPY